MSDATVHLSRQMADDSDAAVRAIGKRCLREYDEFVGMRYAGLTALDSARVEAAATVARAGADESRAEMLDACAAMIRAASGAARTAQARRR